jgi:hypothetical protein
MAGPGRLGTGAAYASRPSSSFGYWRGGMSDGPLAQNQGSFAYGQANSGAGIFAQGSGTAPGAAAWSPTLTYLFVFIAAEMILFGLLGRVLR